MMYHFPKNEVLWQKSGSNAKNAKKENVQPLQVHSSAKKT